MGWFTVAGQLGYPSPRVAAVIASELSELRSAIKVSDDHAFATARTNLLRLPLRRCLSVFLRQANIADEPGGGWVYILSTREIPDLLKIGMTTRTVEERAREINSSTGVAIPFGVRRCWRVSDPARAESTVHGALAEYRIRGDREFFRIEFREAARSLEAVLRHSGLVLRTLDRLAALGG
jgi:hypothetical protein